MILVFIDFYILFNININMMVIFFIFKLYKYIYKKIFQ